MQKSNNSLSQFLLLILVAALGVGLGSIVKNGVIYLIKSGVFSSWAFLDGFGWLKSILIFLSIPVVFILSIAIFVVFQKNKAKRKLTLLIIENIFMLVVFSIGGGIFGFIGGVFVADFKDSLEKKAMAWQLLDSPVKFTQIIEANFNTVWAQTANGKLYFWNLSCEPQQKCKEWVETENIDNNVEGSMEKNSTCSFSRESGAKPSKEPPGKIVECGRFGFVQFYALLEGGTIWYWEIPFSGDGLPSEGYIFALVGIVLGAIISIIIIYRKKNSENK